LHICKWERPIVTYNFDLKEAGKDLEMMASGNSGKVVFYLRGVPEADHVKVNPRVGEL
jgi:hypothetical protein